MSAYGEALRSTTTDTNELDKLTKNLTESQKANVLTTKKLTQTETGAIVTKTASASATGLATFSMQAYTTALLANAKAMLFAIATNPATWIIGIAAAVGLAVSAYKKWNPTIEEQKEKISELKDEYVSLKNELSALDNQIKENEKTITELQNKANQGRITLVEEDQLRKLKLQNELLEQQYKIQQDLTKQKKVELISENRETFYNEFNGSVDESADFNFDIKDFYTPGISDYEQASNQNLVLLAKENQKRLEDAVLSGDENLIKLLEEDKNLLSNELSERSDAILLSFLEYQNNLAQAMNEDGTFDDPADKKMWDDIESWKKSIYEYSNSSGEWNTIEIKAAIDEESLGDLQAELSKKLENGELSEEDLSNYPILIKSLKDANLILEKGQSPASVYLQYLRDIASSQAEVNSTVPDFSFNAENSEDIDAYQSQLNTLNEAVTQISNGTFTKSGLLDLLQEFPELTSKTDDLSFAIESLINDKLAVLKDELREQGASDEILTVFDDLTYEAKNFSLDEILSKLNESYSTIKTVKSEVKETKKISVETLQDIISKYPGLISVVDEYLEGKSDENAIINALDEKYATDLDNYKAYMLQKKGEDVSFYEQVITNMSDDLKNEAESYGIKLTDYKNYNEARLELDRQYQLKKAKLEKQQATAAIIAETLKGKGIGTDKPFSLTDMFNMQIFSELEKTKEDLEEYENFLENFDTSLKLEIPDFKTTLLTPPTTGSGDDKETINTIDWAANSISNLTREIESLNQAIDDTSNFDDKLELITALKSKQEELLGIQEKAVGSYKDEYTNSLKKLSKSEKNKYQNLIESDTDVTIEYFEGEDREKVFNKVSAAQEAWQAYQEALVEYENQVKEVAETDKLTYETEQAKLSGQVSRHENNAQDYQNVVDIKESKNGYADLVDYENLYNENELLLEDLRTQREKAKEHRKKMLEDHGVNSQEYIDANNEVQELQDSVYNLKQEQVDLNRTILEYPIHKLEEAKEVLEEQLEDYKKREEQLSSSISAASYILDEEINYYNSLKETITETFDAQIEAINQKKEALTETNEALENQMALQEAQYNLDKALTQKTVRVIRNKQFVYEADVEAIRDAQSELDNIKYNDAINSLDKQITNIEAAKEQALKGVETQIEALTKYKESIDSIIGSYEKALQYQTLLSMFGTNADEHLRNMDETIYNQLFSSYTENAENITSIEEQIATYEVAIAEVELLVERWNGAKKTIEDAKKAIETVLADTESELKSIETRNTAAKSIATEWDKVQKAIDASLTLSETDMTSTKDVEASLLTERLANIKAFADAASSYLASVNSGAGVAGKAINTATTAGINIGAAAYFANGKYSESKSGDKKKTKAVKKHSGMETGFVGEKKLINPEEAFRTISLTKLEPDEVPAILQVGESVLTKLQQTNILDNMSSAFRAGMKLPNFNNIQKASNTTPSITFNGDIVLQGVNNTTELAKKIKSEFLTKLNQELYK